MSRRFVYPFACLLAIAFVQSAAADEIVLRSSNVTTMRGNWRIASDGSAAGGQYIASTDYNWATDPMAQPNDYFEMSFNAPANTVHHVWFRLRATGNSKWNDSVWVQYSDALTTGGSPVYRIGTTSALDVNLERCSGCGTSGWGWQDGAYWLSQATTVKFANSGSHTIRVQIREDGAQIDQVIISSGAYLSSAPGGLTNDGTIVPLSGAATSATGPYLGSPVALPGRVEAENFDNGSDGVSYHDVTPGNSGGAHRQTNADIEGCAVGGYNVGWIETGEWMNYSVKPSASGSYTVKLRVASPGGGGSLHIGFNGPSSVWKAVAIPATGGWQSWTTVSVPVTLGAGSQLMTLAYDTGGFNLDYIEVASGSTSTPEAPAPPPPSAYGVTLPVVTWNVKLNTGAAHAEQSIDQLMALSPRPQVVVLQEAWAPLYDVYVSRLQARTGQTWRGAFQSHCPPGAWNGSSCGWGENEGVAVFTSLPVLDSSTTLLPYADQWHSARAMVRLAVSVNGITLQVFGAHLQSNATARNSSMTYIENYAAMYSKPQIVGGDFNADRDQIDTTTGMRPSFIDTWGMVGSGSGFTCNTPYPTMKLDYWFTDSGGRAVPDWTKVVTGTGTFSDHFPVFTSFTIR